MDVIHKAVITHKKQINATVTNEQWVEKHSNPKTRRFSLRSSAELTKRRERRQRMLSLISLKNISAWASSDFSPKKVWNNYKPRIKGRHSSKFLFFQTFSLPHSLCLLWFLNQLNWDKSKFCWAALRGERWQKSLGKYWNQWITLKLDQTCLMCCLQCISHWGNPIRQTKWAWCVCFFLHCHRETHLFNKQQPTLKVIQAEKTSAHCNTANSQSWKKSRSYSLLLAQMIVSHFRLQLPWWHKCTFMRREIPDNLMSFSSVAFGNLLLLSSAV